MIALVTTLLLATSSSTSDGLSWSSLIVFAGGVIAALGAVVAALVTARAAESRLEQTLAAERERSDLAQRAESDRAQHQLAHERYLARRAEASAAIERAARLMTSSGYKILLCVHSYRGGNRPGSKELDELDLELHRLGEEEDILALRFGAGTPVTEAASRMIKALNAALPAAAELPLSEARKAELDEAEKEVYEASNHFLAVGREAIDDFA